VSFGSTVISYYKLIEDVLSPHSLKSWELALWLANNTSDNMPVAFIRQFLASSIKATVDLNRKFAYLSRFIAGLREPERKLILSGFEPEIQTACLEFFKESPEARKLYQLFSS